ncbi:MAG: glycosyltransferase family 2 protein [Hyphomicrobiales bacterium]|nr:glycosyltransferase family 2 protein [Hyphomicrobiales bacterium]
MHPRPEPVVDILVAAWNRSETIERAVTSALSEAEVHNVIVIDDGSTDDTSARARRAGGGSQRLTVLRLPSNLGPSAARNRGLEVSTAPYVAILDGDDFFQPGRMAKLLTHAGAFDFVADDILETDSTGVLRPRMFEPRFEPWQLDFATFVEGNSTRHGRNRAELGYLKPLIRRAFIDAHELRYDERLRLGEDYAFYARALALGAQFLVTPALGYVSEPRADSLSARHGKRDLEKLRDVDAELACIPGLCDGDLRALRHHFRSVDGRAQWLGVIDAFKRRDPTGFVSPFTRSPEVSIFIAKKLIEEAFQRSGKWLSQQKRP